MPPFGRRQGVEKRKQVVFHLTIAAIRLLFRPAATGLLRQRSPLITRAKLKILAKLPRAVRCRRAETFSLDLFRRKTSAAVPASILKTYRANPQ
jgi:hypothetical protein